MPTSRVTECRWFWAGLLGLAMTVGGVLALAIAATTVVLPYDETFCGLTREQLTAVNSRLLPFLAHDRISLAGSMISCGILYVALAIGSRRGWAWADRTLFTSAFVGFASFFLFLGFGYFDPFHAFVAAVLMQVILMALLAKPTPPIVTYIETLPTVRARAGQWVLTIHAASLIAGGLVFALLGSTHVFVAEDLVFMNTTDAALRSASPRLVPLIAHDRASLGGMLLSNGIAFLLGTRWGYRPGSSWLWRSWLLGGSVAYGATLAIHFAVGYTAFVHLAPAYTGVVLLVVGLGLSRGYLVAKQSIPHS